MGNYNLKFNLEKCLEYINSIEDVCAFVSNIDKQNNIIWEDEIRMKEFLSNFLRDCKEQSKLLSDYDFLKWIKQAHLNCRYAKSEALKEINPLIKNEIRDSRDKKELKRLLL